jgi:integrase
MASLVKNGKNYGLIWSDSDRVPRQVRESLKTDSRPRAIGKKKQLEWEYLNGEHDPWKRKWYERDVTIEGISISDAVEQFISEKSTARGRYGWNEATATKEAFVMRKFARMNQMPVNSLTEKDLENFYYRKEVNSDHTRNSDYISINTFLNWCISNDYIKEKPVFKPQKPQSKIPKFIYPAELSKLIQYRTNKMKSDLNYSIMKPDRAAYWTVLCWMVLAGTGIRPIELSNVKVSHVHSDHIIIGEDFSTKTKSERRVPLLFESRQAAQILTDPAFRSRESFMKSSPYLTGRKPSYSKEELSRDFSITWKNFFPNKPKRTLYNLKDTFCVRFLCDDSIESHSGMRLNDLREILGHESLETTQKYLKAIPYGPA